MLGPVLKKEIHLLYIKRIAVIALIGLALVLVGVCYLEYSRLDDVLLDAAVKESLGFAELAADQLPNADEYQRQFARLLDRTSFLHLTLYSSTQEILVQVSRGAGPEVFAHLNARGIDVPLGGEPDGVRQLFNKRLYQLVALPDLTLSGTNGKGHIKAIYQVSLADMQQLFYRLLLSLCIGVGTVLVCSLLTYLGFMTLTNHLIQNTAKLSQANTFLMRHLGSALAVYDAHDQGHNQRVVMYSIALAERAKLTREKIRGLIVGAFLHDLGMLEVSPKILLQESRLSEDERNHLGDHVEAGIRKMKKISWLKQGIPVIQMHHERYDGTGYPAHLSHEKLPIEVRIFSIAASFDALMTDRPYREALELEEALEEMEKNSATHFDPVLLSEFLEIAPALFHKFQVLKHADLDRELDKYLRRYLKV